MKLKEWRDDVGRSVADVADELGCTRQAVHRYETGRLPSPDALADIVRMTGGLVTPNDWFDFHELAPTSSARPAIAGGVIRWEARSVNTAQKVQ